jgi:drug/metabolite transporter (DMT)-like permease
MADLLTAVLSLSAAISWGSGEFTSGLAARRSGPFRTVLFVYSFGLVALIVIAIVLREVIPRSPDILWGALAGVSEMMGLWFLLKGFSGGRMGIISPVSGVLAAAIPVVFEGVTKGIPGTSQMVGFGLALSGIWLLSRPERSGLRVAGLAMGLLAGIGFGGFFTLLGQVSEGAVFWPLVAGRVSACGLMVIVFFVTHRTPRARDLPLSLIALAGTLDAAGNLLFLLAVQHGRLDIAAVLGSLYPGATAILARVLGGEQMTRLQLAGVISALAAIVLITA